MIYNNNLLKTKVVPIDTENRKKYVLPLRYGKVTDISASFLETLSNLENSDNYTEEEFFVVDSIDFPVKK
jgi:hypothetical protein